MIKDRFRKYLPVVIDLETGGFDSKTNAILEIAATLISENEKTQLLEVGETYRYHIEPYEGLIVEQESLDFTKIKLDHPLRNAISEKDALDDLFKIINTRYTLIDVSKTLLNKLKELKATTSEQAVNILQPIKEEQELKLLIWAFQEMLNFRR